MKKIIALCLIVCLSLSLSPFSSVATAEWDWERIRSFIPSQELIVGVVAFSVLPYVGYDNVKRARQEASERREERQRLIQQIAQEFYNYETSIYKCGHFVAQDDRSREYFVPYVQRYFEKPENVEHIKKMDIDHFAKAVFGERNILHSPAIRTEYENFLRNQIVKLPKIEALLPTIIISHSLWQDRPSL